MEYDFEKVNAALEGRNQEIAAAMGIVQAKNGKFHCIHTAKHNNGDADASLSIDNITGKAKCHGCQYEGNVQDLAKIIYGVNDGVKKVLELAGESSDNFVADTGVNETNHVKADPPRPMVEHDDAVDAKIISILHQAFLSGSKPQEYWKRRNHSPAIAETFNIGYADFDVLLKVAKEVGYDYLAKIGLATKSETSKTGYKFTIFGPAIITPVMVNGKLSYLRAKYLDKSQEAKPQVKAEYRQPDTLFLNQDVLLKLIKGDKLFVAEGENDFLSLIDKCGQTNVIATLGGLTHDQIDALVKLILNKGIQLYLCFDNDNAGRKYHQNLVSKVSEKVDSTYHLPLVNVLRNFEADGKEWKDVDDILRADSSPESFFSRFEKYQIMAECYCFNGVWVEPLGNSGAKQYAHIAIHPATMCETMRTVKNTDDGISTNEIANFSVCVIRKKRENHLAMGKFLIKTTYELLLKQGNQSKIVEIDDADFVDDRKLRALINSTLHTPNFAKKMLDYIRNVAMNSTKPIPSEDMAYTLGWDVKNGVYKTPSVHIMLDGSIIPISNPIPFLRGTQQFAKKDMKILSSERRIEVEQFLFQEGLFLHEPWITTTSIGTTVSGWFRRYTFERYTKAGEYEYVGGTGSGKTTIQALGLALDGNPNARVPFESTANYFYMASFVLNDHVLGIDDKKDDLKGQTENDHIVRFVQIHHDGGGRNRMTDSDPMVCQSTLTVSGEHSFASIPSIAGRIVTFELKPYHEVSNGKNTLAIYKKLPEYHNDFCGLKPELMSFILKVYGINGLYALIDQEIEFFRQVDETAVNIDRIAFNLALAKVGSYLFLDYGVHRGVIDIDVVSEIRRSINEKYLEVCRKQIVRVSSLSASSEYLEYISEGIASGEIKYLSDDDTRPFDEHSVIGYTTDGLYYTLPQKSVAYFNRKRKDNGSACSVSAKHIGALLRSEGHLDCPIKDENVVRKSFRSGAVEARYWPIRATSLHVDQKADFELNTISAIVSKMKSLKGSICDNEAYVKALVAVERLELNVRLPQICLNAMRGSL